MNAQQYGGMSGVSGGGTGGGGYEAKSAADSSSKTDYQNAHSAVAGAGNRGFEVNIAFPNANINADAGINEPSALLGPNVTKYALYAGIGILALALLKKFAH